MLKSTQTYSHLNHQHTRISIHRDVTLRKQYFASIPHWRRPLVGYFASILLVGSALLCTLFLRTVFISLSFPDVLFLLSVLPTALIWGVGPAIFSLLLSTFVLDYFFVLPVGQLDLYSLNGIVQIIPYIIAGLVIALITGQREQARWRSLETEQELQAYAEELEEANAKLEDANTQLKDADQLKDRFLSVASHELKTPVMTIRNQALIILRRLSKLSELSSDLVTVRAYLEKFDEQMRHLNALVNDLLDISSIRSGTVALNLKTCDFVSLCRNLVEDQRLLTGRTIDIDIPYVPLMLNADRYRLNQVIVNLIDNAIKFSPEHEPIYICIKQQDNLAVLEVCDRGLGIPTEIQEHIFEPFYSAQSTQEGQGSALGLGLAICKDIVERHEGSIRCDFLRDRGCKFIVELPIISIRT